MGDNLQIQENEVFEEIGRLHMMQVRMAKVLAKKDEDIKELTSKEGDVTV